MNWKNNKMRALEIILDEFDRRSLYNDQKHRSLFHQLTNCYCEKAFFTSGMIKCMFMAAWDDEHFAQLLNQLMDMSFTSIQEGLSDMAVNGELMAEESVRFENSTDACLYQLSCSFITDQPFDYGSIPADLTEHGQKVLNLSLKAAAVIDMIVGDIPFN